jgi:uncharacterized protein (TIGR03086 family)
MMATRHGTAEVTLPSDREILITRRFEAPLRLIWEALTEPRHLLRWWGPDWCPLVACEIDFRVGGSWRYVSRDTDGNELGWHGNYREIEGPHRILSTEVFEGFPDAESLNTMTLADEGGVTCLQTLVQHATKEYRDGHIASGMEGGMQGTFNRLDDLLATFDTPAEHFRRVAGHFTDRARQVPAAGWDSPAPCEGWVARDIVRHLVEWMPDFILRAGVVLPAGPSIDSNPAGAWVHVADSMQALLDDPELAAREFDAGPPGRQTIESAVSMIMLGDILIHTWDLARATGLDESLDPEIVADMLAGMEPLDEQLRQSGHYGPKVPVPESADKQTKLIAFTGRTPG